MCSLPWGPPYSKTFKKEQGNTKSNYRKRFCSRRRKFKSVRNMDKTLYHILIGSNPKCLPSQPIHHSSLLILKLNAMPSSIIPGIILDDWFCVPFHILMVTNSHELSPFSSQISDDTTSSFFILPSSPNDRSLTLQPKVLLKYKTNLVHFHHETLKCLPITHTDVLHQ